MNKEDFLKSMREGVPAAGDSPQLPFMRELAQEAMKITAKLNGAYNTPEEVRALMSELIGKPLDNGFALFPPFYSECGKNISIGKNVFINSGCHFQDWGGVYIGDGSLIGSYVVIATINHGETPQSRADNHPAPVHIGKGVWIGSHATILPGVSIGDNAIVAAGAVVTRDVAPNTVVGGVPAREIRKIKEA